MSTKKESVRDCVARLRNLLVIRREALDDELVRQPQLMFEAGELMARALSLRDRAKDDLKRTTAAASSTVRGEMDKATEAKVSAEVEQRRDVGEATDALRVATRLANEAQAVKEAFAQRGYVLRDLCSLFISGYFSSSSVNAGARSIEDVEAEKHAREMSQIRKKRVREEARC